MKGQAAHYAYPATLTDSRRIAVPYSGQWTTTGWYALPGQTITLRRTDNADVSATVRLNYHRPNTNRAYEQKIYRAPLELTTGRLILAKGAASPSPLLMAALSTSIWKGAASLAVQVSATGVTRHPAIMDFSDEQQIREFNERLEQTELPHIDLRADGAEQHLRRDRFTKAVGGVIPDTNALLDSIARDHINGVYTLAGLKIQGKGLDESLPADVKNACVALLGRVVSMSRFIPAPSSSMPTMTRMPIAAVVAVATRGTRPAASARPAGSTITSWATTCRPTG